MNASDIHFDPQDDGMRIRYRIDGVMRTERTLPAGMVPVITARIKIMSNLNVAERRMPQDGRIELDLELRKVDIRVATLPTLYGEKIVMRVLDMSSSLAAVHQLGFSEQNREAFVKGISRAHGVVLLTGPTGSGKTTTLYSALAHLNRDDVNVITVEDPVEYHLTGINQVQVNPVTGLTFAKGLRSILRQDPNIIMVGEIRDSETAEIVVRASMTGHLVLSTLHTNNAVNTISRLIDMGVEPFLIASSVSTIVAQRLVRRICPHCKEERNVELEEAEQLRMYRIQADKLYRGRGCGECGRTGYKGRLPIHEVVTVDHGMRALILQKRPDQEYATYAQERGFVPIMADGLMKAVEGHTTVSEVFRVISRDDG